MVITDLLTEMDNGIIEKMPDGYESEKDDQSTLKMKDVRKTRLTLGQLNKLRIINDVKKIERDQKLKKVAVQYSPPAGDAGGMM